MGRVAFRLVVVVLTLTLVGEGVARLWITSPSGQVFDPELGWAWRPGATVLNRKEGGAPFVVNALGLNDDEITAKGDRFRLLGFGNSFMEALQVERSDNYTARVEAGRAGLDFVNLARSAMGPAHYPLVLKRYAERLEPDLLVVSLGEGDLVHLMGPTVAVERSGGRITRVSPLLEGKDRLKDLFGPLLSRSALATHMMRRLKPVVQGVLDAPAPEAASAAPAKLDLVEAEARLAWILTEMRRVAPVLVLDVPQLRYLPAGTTMLGDPTEGHTYQRAATGVADYLDAGPALIATYRASGQPGHGFSNLEVGRGHLNERGHEAVAAALLGWLEARRP